MKRENYYTRTNLPQPTKSKCISSFVFPTLSKNSISLFFLKKRKYERVFFFFLYNERRKTKKKKVTTFFFSLSRSSPFFFLFTFVDKNGWATKAARDCLFYFFLSDGVTHRAVPPRKKKNPKINARREKERETLTAMRKKK